VVTIADVTPLHEVQEQREDLVRMVSHDLRGPLTSVLGQAQMMAVLLERTGQDGSLRRGAEAIVTGAKRMNVMIQDLVDVARVESGQLDLKRAPVDLRPYVLELKQRLVGVLDTDRIQVEIPENLSPVWADPDRLERVLTNLLSNGLKYSQAEVRVTADRAGGEVRVSVSDRGAGIAPDDQAHLFERFYRAKGTRKAEGLGLGLYITRMLVEAMAGRVWVESEVGEGSTFSFSLPVVGTRP
jgi:signal transduction histidine kinase